MHIYLNPRQNRPMVGCHKFYALGTLFPIIDHSNVNIFRASEYGRNLQDNYYVKRLGSIIILSSWLLKLHSNWDNMLNIYSYNKPIVDSISHWIKQKAGNLLKILGLLLLFLLWDIVCFEDLNIILPFLTSSIALRMVSIGSPN